MRCSERRHRAAVPIAASRGRRRWSFGDFARMKKQDDYIAGSYHYWTHFWCGLIFGAGLGVWMGWGIFDSG